MHALSLFPSHPHTLHKSSLFFKAPSGACDHFGMTNSTTQAPFTPRQPTDPRGPGFPDSGPGASLHTPHEVSRWPVRGHPRHASLLLTPPGAGAPPRMPVSLPGPNWLPTGASVPILPAGLSSCPSPSVGSALCLLLLDASRSLDSHLQVLFWDAVLTPHSSAVTGSFHRCPTRPRAPGVTPHAHALGPTWDPVHPAGDPWRTGPRSIASSLPRAFPPTPSKGHPRERPSGRRASARALLPPPGASGRLCSAGSLLTPLPSRPDSEGGELRTLTSLCFDFTHSEDTDWGPFQSDSQWGDSSRNLNN